MREPVHIAVVMVGVWDRYGLRNARGKRILSIRRNGARSGRRADLFMKALKRRGVAVYWVGLPSLRRYEANEDAQVTNEVVRERAYLNGLKYIDAYAAFADEGGGYSAYGPDETGKIRLLREADGVHLTDAGNRKLAHFVERENPADLVQAKNERDIPLAGGEAEQAKIRPEKQQPASDAGGGERRRARPEGAGAGAHAGEKADNGRVNLRAVGPSGREEIIALDILRPAIPASIVALVTRRESPDKAAAMGDTLIDQIPGGLTVMARSRPPARRAVRGASCRRRSPRTTACWSEASACRRGPAGPTTPRGRAREANAGPERPPRQILPAPNGRRWKRCSRIRLVSRGGGLRVAHPPCARMAAPGPFSFFSGPAGSGRGSGVLVLGEQLAKLRVAQRVARGVGEQVLLGDVGDVLGLRVLGEQVIVGLVLAWAHLLGIDSHHSSVLLNTGSMSKITPRNGYIRWRTTCPTANFALRMRRARPSLSACWPFWHSTPRVCPCQLEPRRGCRPFPRLQSP